LILQMKRTTGNNTGQPLYASSGISSPGGGRGTVQEPSWTDLKTVDRKVSGFESHSLRRYLSACSEYCGTLEPHTDTTSMGHPCMTIAPVTHDLAVKSQPIVSRVRALAGSSPHHGAPQQSLHLTAHMRRSRWSSLAAAAVDEHSRRSMVPIVSP
jgi:hypothetical protein